MSFWKRLISGGSPPKPDLSDRPSNIKMLAELIDEQLNKARTTNAPRRLLADVQALAYTNLEQLNSLILGVVSANVPRRVSLNDQSSRIYFVVEVLPYSTPVAIDKLREASVDPSLGYGELMTNLFLNNWPSSKLKYFFHIVACIDGVTERLDVHTALGRYGGSPRGSHRFYQIPGGLLNAEERRLTDRLFRDV